MQQHQFCRSKRQGPATKEVAESPREEDGVHCQPTTSAAEKRLEATEEEHIARKRHIAKQRKRALERLVQAKRQKK